MPGKRLAVPPGRAGRLWLQRRLQVAGRGAELLERKLRILRAELEVLRAEQARAAADWDRCLADAELWLLRASLLGGQRSIRLGADGGLADVTVSYASAMGVRYPSGASCAIPEPQTWDGPVLSSTRQAYRAALAAAVRHAAATEAVRRVEAETIATRYRVRSIRDRWVPRLEQALAGVMLAIEEQEIADAARLRLGSGRLAGNRAAAGKPRARSD
jgi:V/A-type H+/Na+-transporting ATPase subunit D